MYTTHWPTGDNMIRSFNIFFTLVTYVVPMLQMLISYTHISLVLWSEDFLNSHQNQPDNPQASQQRAGAISNKRKVCFYLSLLISTSKEWKYNTGQPSQNETPCKKKSLEHNRWSFAHFDYCAWSRDDKKGSQANIFTNWKIALGRTHA